MASSPTGLGERVSSTSFLRQTEVSLSRRAVNVPYAIQLGYTEDGRHVVSSSDVDGLLPGDEICHLNMLDVGHISHRDLLVMVRPTTVLLAKLRRYQDGHPKAKYELCARTSTVGLSDSDKANTLKKASARATSAIRHSTAAVPGAVEALPGAPEDGRATHARVAPVARRSHTVIGSDDGPGDIPSLGLGDGSAAAATASAAAAKKAKLSRRQSQALDKRMLTIGTPTNFVHKSHMTHNEAIRAVDRKAPEPEIPTLGADLGGGGRGGGKKNMLFRRQSQALDKRVIKIGTPTNFRHTEHVSATDIPALAVRATPPAAAAWGGEARASPGELEAADGTDMEPATPTRLVTAPPSTAASPTRAFPGGSGGGPADTGELFGEELKDMDRKLRDHIEKLESAGGPGQQNAMDFETRMLQTEAQAKADDARLLTGTTGPGMTTEFALVDKSPGAEAAAAVMTGAPNAAPADASYSPSKGDNRAMQQPVAASSPNDERPGAVNNLVTASPNMFAVRKLTLTQHCGAAHSPTQAKPRPADDPSLSQHGAQAADPVETAAATGDPSDVAVTAQSQHTVTAQSQRWDPRILAGPTGVEPDPPPMTGAIGSAANAAGIGIVSREHCHSATLLGVSDEWSAQAAKVLDMGALAAKKLAEAEAFLSDSHLVQGVKPTDKGKGTAVRMMVCCKNYYPEEMSVYENTEDELTMVLGTPVKVFGELGEDGYFVGEIGGKRGLVPADYLAEAPVGSPVPVTTATDTEKSPVVMEVFAITDYNPDTMSPFGNTGDELRLVKGQVVRVHGEPGSDGYYVGESNEKWGLIPSSVVQPLNPVATAAAATATAAKPAANAATPSAAHPHAMASPPSAENCLVKAMYAYQGRNKNELSFKKGALFTLTKASSPDWFKVKAADGESGYVPANYVRRRKPRGNAAEAMM